MATFFDRIVIPRSRSRGFVSNSSSPETCVSRKFPLWRRSWSIRVVLPWSTWAITATFRRSLRTAALGGTVLDEGAEMVPAAWSMGWIRGRDRRSGIHKTFAKGFGVAPMAKNPLSLPPRHALAAEKVPPRAPHPAPKAPAEVVRLAHGRRRPRPPGLAPAGSPHRRRWPSPPPPARLGQSPAPASRPGDRRPPDRLGALFPPPLRRPPAV